MGKLATNVHVYIHIYIIFFARYSEQKITLVTKHSSGGGARREWG